MAVISMRMRWTRSFTPWKQAAFSLIGIGLAGFLAFVYFFATREQLRFIGAHDLDKIPHFLGGVFIAIAYEWLAFRPRIWKLVLVVLAVTIAWEAYKYLFDLDVRYYAHHMTDLWRRDVMRDIAVAFLGSILWWLGFTDQHAKD